MCAGIMFFVSPIPSIIILLLLFFTINKSSGHNTSNTAWPCPPSSCGTIKNIRYPFRLKTDPRFCGINHTDFELDCHNNQTVLMIMSANLSKYYYVQEINYKDRLIRLVEPGLSRGNLSSCSSYAIVDLRMSSANYYLSPYRNEPVSFIHCLDRMNSTKYVEAPFCGNRSNIFANSSEFYSYVMVGEFNLSDLEESCTVDKAGWASRSGPMKDNSSSASIYVAFAYGFELHWDIFDQTCRKIDLSYLVYGATKYIGNTPRYHGDPFVRFWRELIRYIREIKLDIYYYNDYACHSERGYKISSLTLAIRSAVYGMGVVACLLALKLVMLVTGFPLLIWLVVHKWRRRHLCMDKNIEKFLQDHRYNFAPIKYTYSEIKKMTNNFMQKLGEGGYGTVYKGELRSGPYVAIKMMEQSMATEEEFINEVGTIGQIHHTNIVQLIGFCVESSKYALVYEFLPNGSLDRYISNRHVLALTFEKMYEIALGVANGIHYLHHGCNMQILHFDIKPHNILLDEKFNPKISDFGLAGLYPTGESCINLTAARGTMGYMAPEMFYKNLGSISHKVDVYSFGMMLMEMVAKRKNTNSFVEDTSQVHFPLWVYDQLCAGEDICATDAEEEERKMVKKVVIVALWCIQLRPSKRPSINKVVDMLEDEFEPQMPPKPFIASREIATNDDQITLSYRIDYVNMDDLG